MGEKFNLSRREFLILSGSAVASTMIGVSCDSDNLQMELVQPQVRQSVAGFLDTVLKIGFAQNKISGQEGGQTIYTRTYEGLLPGPTLRLKTEDVMNIRLINNLPPNKDVDDVNVLMPHAINTTNLHTHGLHVSPSGSSDNVLLRINPDEDFDYTIELPPNQPGGTYWYHPHKHGSVTTQMQGGMSGAIIIEGELDKVPEVAAARDIMMVLQEIQLNDDGEVEPPDETATDIGDVYPADNIYYTVNGQLNPILRAQPGEVLRLRLLNATIGTFYPYSLVDHDLNLIAIDGISLSELETYDTVTSGPGNRHDILIKAGEPGTYLFNGLEYARSESIVRDQVTLFTLIVEGEPVDMGLPTNLPAPFQSISDEEIVETRELIFDTVDNTGQFPPGYFVDIAFTIDGALYDEDVVNQTVELGTAEEWTITNNATEVHNFHIHTNPFEVIAVNGEKLDTPVWYDTFPMPANGGSFTFRSRFIDFTGEFVLHCHILDHEDLGMMQNVKVEA